jgi:hypothetical protein
MIPAVKSLALAANRKSAWLWTAGSTPEGGRQIQPLVSNDRW